MVGSSVSPRPGKRSRDEIEDDLQQSGLNRSNGASAPGDGVSLT